MNIWVMSDLHVDSNHYALPTTPAGADILVIAGDVADGHHRTLRWLQTHAVPTGLPIIYVQGNHDLYGFDFTDHHEDEYEKIGVTLLHAGRPSVVIGGARFVGVTLWTDFKIAGDRTAGMAWFNTSMPDAKDIDVGMRRLRARDVEAQHLIERARIEAAMTEKFDGPNVVVTHHAPHRSSLADPDDVNASDASWASDLTEVMAKHRPAVWIHGHTHTRRDYVIAGTRVVANQRGYSEGSKHFDPALIIDV